MNAFQTNSCRDIYKFHPLLSATRQNELPKWSRPHVNPLKPNHKLPQPRERTIRSRSTRRKKKNNHFNRAVIHPLDLSAAEIETYSKRIRTWNRESGTLTGMTRMVVLLGRLRQTSGKKQSLLHTTNICDLLCIFGNRPPPYGGWNMSASDLQARTFEFRGW